jgi:hypothetical protein
MLFFSSESGGGAGASSAESGAGGASAAAPAAGGAATLLPGSGSSSQQSEASSSSWNWAKEDGSLSDGWLEHLPDGLRGHASLKPIGSLQDLAKSYVETKKLIGAKFEMPGENASPEQIANWRKTVGAPDKPEGYLGEAKSLRPEAVPENLWSAETEKQFLALAHKHHLPPGAVKEILGFHAQDLVRGLTAVQEKQASILKDEGVKLRSAWGQEYDTNLNLAARMAKTVGLDPQSHPIFTNAEVVQAFAKMGRLLSEDKLVRGDATGVNGSISDRVREITDPNGAGALAREYRGEFGPERQAAAQRQLHELMQAQNTR